MPKKVDFGFTPSKYQQNIFDFVQHGVGNAVVKAKAGSAKCLGRNTEILMYDGSIKKVQDINVGDKIMGDDSTPRTVLSTTNGFAPLRMIIPRKGEPWICNNEHILTLYKYISSKKNREKYGSIYDISIKDFEKKSPSKHKTGDYRNYKLLRTGVKFKSQKISFDPWLYGIWLGDGSTKQSKITSIDTEIIDEIKKLLPEENYISVKKYKNKAPTISILCHTHKKYENKFRQFIRKSSDKDGKFILKEYLINNEENRLKLLAGLMDSDGYYKEGNYYISTKFDQLADDILFLCRSLGFAAYDKYNNRTCTNNGVTKKYHNITISGDIDKIPVVLKRKKAQKRIINKNALHVGFQIKDAGFGEYYGFTIDGNGRFLLGDFTITHNTTTMVAAMQLIPKSRKCLFIAFNKPIVDELNQKLEGRPNCTAKTIHGLGYSIICANFDEKPSLDEYKYRNYLKNNVCELSQIDCEGTTREILEEYVENVSQLIHFSRYNLCQTVKEIKEIAQRYDIPYHHDECEVTLKCLQWGKKNTNTIDYTDMVWLPYELGLSGKGNQYDWVFFDEAQDASKAYVDIFLRAFKRGTRFIAAGDDFQRINLFAGSSEDAFNYLACYPHTQTFELPICYRCDKKIIELSQTLVPDIQYRDDAGDGVILENCHLDEVHDGDMVLCRSKGPLMRLYTRFIKKGVNCYIKGKDIGTNLIELIESANTDIIGRELVSDGLFIRLYERLINVRNNVMKKHNIDIWDASVSLQVMELYDMINVLITLSEGCKNTKEMAEKIESIFQDDAKGVCLSTIHKSKGLESDNVYIICASTMPPKRAKKDWEKLQEQNLIYVAYTRPKHKLGFISEVEVPPAGASLNDEDIVNDIAFIEKQVCRVLGTPLTEDNASANFAKFRLKAATEIEDTHVNDNVMYIKRNEVPEEETSLDDILKELGG